MTPDLDFPSTQGKTMHKNLLRLIASPCSIKKQYQCSSTYMSNINTQNDAPEHPFSTFTLFSQPPVSELEKQPCCRLLLQSACGQQPAEAAREEKAAFLPFFPQAREDDALSSRLAFSSKSNVRLLHYSNWKENWFSVMLLLEEFKTEKTHCPLPTWQSGWGRSQAKKNPSLEKLSRF